jgi:hypothetical protein
MNEPSKEIIIPRKTILDALNKLLSPQNEGEMQELYILLIINQYVINAGYRPTIQQFRQYFEQLKKGFEYLLKTYGVEALPTEIVIYQEGMKIGQLEDPAWIGYLPEKDLVGVSLLHIAKQCSQYDDPDALFGDSHLPEGVGVRGRDSTVLQAIEEGYHRYQIKVLGLKAENSMRDDKNPLEAGVIPVYQRAIKDLGIQTYKTPSFNFTQVINAQTGK